jgi:putative GTP pyrophosphokinase
MTKGEIDRLGVRLRDGTASSSDLELLDRYRRSFSPALEDVAAIIRDTLSTDPGKRIKLPRSIIEELRRQKTSLSRIQDIAGCRVIVDNLVAQESVVASLTSVFQGVKVVDRRQKPSHGYRAVHLIVRSRDKLVEIQVRTLIQDLWAQLTEKLHDKVDPEIKYGGGPEQFRSPLTQISATAAFLEREESFVADDVAGTEAYGEGLSERPSALARWRRQLMDEVQQLLSLIERMN